MMAKQIKEISQQRSEKIILKLVKKCNDDIERCNGHFDEMREKGDTVGSFLTSHITDSEDEKKGIEFCRGKTLTELKAFLKNEQLPKSTPIDKSLYGEAFEKALVGDPRYRNGWVRIGIEKYLKAAEVSL